MIILAPAIMMAGLFLMLLSPYCNARHYFLRVAFYQESFSHFKKDPAFLQDPHSQSYFSLSI